MIIAVNYIAHARTLANRRNLDAMGLAALPPIVAVMAPTPRSVGVAELIYGAIATALVVRSVMRVVSGRAELPPRWLWLPFAALVAVLLLSFAWSIPGGTSIAAWLRGLAPFSGVLLLIPAYDVARSPEARRIVIVGILVGAAIVYAQVLVAAALALPRAIESGTPSVIRNYLPAQAYSVLGLAGFAFLAGYLGSAGRRQRESVVAAGIAIVALLLTFLRIFAVLVPLLVIAAAWLRLRGGRGARWLTRQRVLVLSAAVGVAIVLGALIVPVRDAFDAVAGAYVDRFASLLTSGFDNTRIAELRTVIGEWRESPLVGRGPGYEYTYVRPESGMVWRGAYTHNLLSYLLLAAGSVGLAIGTWLLIAMLRAVRFGRTVSAVGMGTRFAVVVVLVYAMVQATFRTVGFWPLLVILVAIMVSEAWRTDTDTRPAP